MPERSLKDKLVELDKGKGVVFYHQFGGVEKSYLLCKPTDRKSDFLSLMLFYGTQISLHVYEPYLFELKTLNEIHGPAFALPCDLSARGIEKTVQCILGDKLHECHGEDLVMVRPYKNPQRMNHETVEGWMIELVKETGAKNPLFMSAHLLNEKGVSLSKDEAYKLAAEKGLTMITYEDIIAARIEQDALLELTGVMETDLLMGSFKLHSYYSRIDGRYHWAFVKGDLKENKGTPLVRIESECLTGHVFGSLLCDCGRQLEKGLEMIEKAGHGALVYLRQEGRGIGLVSKIKAYKLQQQEKLDTVDANLALGMPEDARDYIIGAQILKSLGISNLDLLTNNPAKVEGLEKYGIVVGKRVPHIIPATTHNKKYLDTKKARMGHLM